MILHRQSYQWFWPYWGALAVLIAVAAWLGFGREPILPDKDDPYDFAFTHLNLRLSQRALFQLRLKRADALEKQALTTQSWDWVPGVLQVPNGEFPVHMRLKGDFTDHLQGEKWSFRVKLRDGAAWKGMKAFSLQSPATRGFLKEWQFHRVMEEQGFLTTRYDFVRVSLNGTDWGIYALEEHFGKELIERLHRKEGPILKLNEEGYWATRTDDFRQGERFATDYPVYDGMEIQPFQPRTTLSGRKMRGNFKVGQNLFYSWKYGLRPVEEVFDLDQMARYYALVDVFRAYHCLFSHNLRMYYNPMTCRLEPVAYDAYDGTVPIVYQYEPYLGFEWQEGKTFGEEWDGLLIAFFNNGDFRKAYETYLIEFAEKSKKGDFELELAHDRSVRKKFLRREFRLYSFDQNYFTAEAHEILSSIKTN